MSNPMPAELAADLVKHGIDPAGCVGIYRGCIPALASVRMRGKPARVAVYWYERRWALKRSGRYVADADGGVRTFPSAGAALAWEGEQ